MATRSGQWRGGKGYGQGNCQNWAIVAMGTMGAVATGATATREGMSREKDRLLLQLERLRLLSRFLLRTEPGANTRRSNSVTLENPRAAEGVIREETVQEPDGTMCTEYTFPDGHVERDYW